MASLKNSRLMMIGAVAKYNIFLDNLCLKLPLVLNFPLVCSLTQETQKLP